jgi:ABC transporter substrate binding protein
MVYSREPLEAGALMSYGHDQVTMLKCTAGYVVRILKGEKPAGLRVDQPTAFELIINRPTAKSLGIPLPATLLARANEVTATDAPLLRRMPLEGAASRGVGCGNRGRSFPLERDPFLPKRMRALHL